MAQKLLPRSLGKRPIEMDPRRFFKLTVQGRLVIPANPNEPITLKKTPRNRAERRRLRATLGPEQQS